MQCRGQQLLPPWPQQWWPHKWRTQTPPDSAWNKLNRREGEEGEEGEHIRCRHNEKHLKVHNPRWRFNSWLSQRRSETALPSTNFSYILSLKPSIQADQPIFSTRAKHLASKYSDRPRSLFDAHSPRQPSVSPASPAFSAPESYFTMHASYLIICPRFTLGVAAVTEKNGGHTHTHRQTDCNNPPLRMHAGEG